jgi:hypothetical protein
VTARRIRQFRNWVTLTPRRIAVVALLTLAFLAVAGGGTRQWMHLSSARAAQRERCGAGIEPRDVHGQCLGIGVTDGRYHFSSALAEVEDAIRRQDQRVRGQHPVTIALLMPLTSPLPGMKTEILHAVQGAYAELYQADVLDNEDTPKIRLVLANPGVDSKHWSPVVRELRSMTGPPGGLRAVFGISVSTKWTKAEVGALTRSGIPVVLGAPTADDLANSAQSTPYPGLARVSPSNAQEAAALASYGAVNPAQAIMVADARTDDDYITTLKKAFGKDSQQFAQETHYFNSPADDSKTGWVTSQFNGMMPDICESHAKWIYFAGRQVQLRLFLNALTGRGCVKYTRFTVVTGSAASHLVNDPQLNPQDFTEGGITLDFAAIASPGAWTGNEAGARGSAASYQALTNVLNTAATEPVGPVGPPGNLADGQAIINYDAALTAVTGIRDTGPGMPPIRQVGQEWRQLHGYYKVQGASGWICLDNAGNPYDKAIPIAQYPGTSNDPRTPRFVQIAWPVSNQPPQDNCIIPPNG